MGSASSAPSGNPQVDGGGEDGGQARRGGRCHGRGIAGAAGKVRRCRTALGQPVAGQPPSLWLDGEVAGELPVTCLFIALQVLKHKPREELPPKRHWTAYDEIRRLLTSWQ